MRKIFLDFIVSFLDFSPLGLLNNLFNKSRHTNIAKIFKPNLTNKNRLIEYGGEFNGILFDCFSDFFAIVPTNNFKNEFTFINLSQLFLHC